MARRRKYRSKRRSKSNSSVGWIVLIAALVALIVGVAIGSQQLISKAEVDPATLCHDGDERNATMLLFDLTDPLTETQQNRLRVIVDQTIAAAKDDEFFAMGIVSEFPDRWGKKFAKCKPLTGDAANGLYQNPQLIERRFKEEFFEPVHSTLDQMLEGTVENQSPIMEAMQALIADAPQFLSARGVRRVLIVSDMLQHSENISFYRGQGWDAFIAMGGEARLATNLNGVEVSILRIPRVGSNLPHQELVEEFWVKYFDRQGSQLPTVRSLGDL